jgi:AcrR family transcriptional regulator
VPETSHSGRQGKSGGSSPQAKNGSSGAAGEETQPRQRLTPESITAAAIRIADADGLDAVSIRRIGAELDARPMSLYNHFANKHELLSSMTDQAVGEMLVEQPLPENWREAVAVIARRMHAAYAAHPWLIFVFAQRPTPGPNSVRIAKQQARALSSLPVAQADVWEVQGIVNDYVLGYSFRSVATVDPDEMDAAMSKTDVVEFPELASLPDNLRARRSLERFELGLQTVFDGVERRFLETGDEP